MLVRKLHSDPIFRDPIPDDITADVKIDPDHGRTGSPVVRLALQATARFGTRRDGLSMDTLTSAALAAARHAYAPYSGCRVGAAVRTASGQVFIGCNVENAAFPLTTCAERSAIAAAVVAEGTVCVIVAVAIHAENALGEVLSAAPCGGCRQCIMELGPTAMVGFTAEDGSSVQHPISELLPYSYKLLHLAGSP